MEKTSSSILGQGIDRDSETSLKEMSVQEQALSNRISGVKFVLVVISAKGMVFDLEALRQKIILSYPDSAVFYQTTQGYSIGPSAPEKVDLLIDFTGRGERQGFLYPRKLRKIANFAVGRDAGWFRKRIYDRIIDDHPPKQVNGRSPLDPLQHERIVQKELLNLAGIAFIPAGDTPPDRGKTIPLELPYLQRT